MLAMEGMTGTPQNTSFSGSDANTDLSPFSDTTNHNETLSRSALTGEQRKNHRNFVNKRMVYPRTAATPDQSIEAPTPWRGLRMPAWAPNHDNKTNPSQVIDVPNVDILKENTRKRYDARL
jgi:hypothetical protein